MFFSAFRVEGIWKRAAAVCDARHLLAELWKRVRQRKSAVAMNPYQTSDPLEKHSLGAKDCALHALTTLA
jgi:hypothetical protein